MAFLTKRLATHALAELVVDLELTLADDEVANLHHTRSLRHKVPIDVVAIERRGEDVLRTARQTGLRIGDRGLQLVVEREGHLNERVVAVVADVERVAAWQPDNKTHHREHDRIGCGMLSLEIGLGVCHRIIPLTKNVQLETVVGEVCVVITLDGHRNVAIDIGRTEQVGLDLNLHLRDFRNVVALASEMIGISHVIVGFVIYSVFIFGISIIRGCVVVQETLEQLVKIVITLLVVELQ